MLCQRCGSGAIARWRVRSDIINIAVCHDCAIDARAMQPYGRPRIAGDLEIEEIKGNYILYSLLK